MRKILRGIKVKCEVCGNPTRYKGKEIGYKCYNLKCDSKKINTIKDELKTS